MRKSAMRPERPAMSAETAFAIYRLRHLELQRQMDQAIGPLRDIKSDGAFEGL